MGQLVAVDSALVGLSLSLGLKKKCVGVQVVLVQLYSAVSSLCWSN